jgi:SpoVK/Ycf46/Vps4 family AAA+-type ATPase
MIIDELDSLFPKSQSSSMDATQTEMDKTMISSFFHCLEDINDWNNYEFTQYSSNTTGEASSTVQRKQITVIGMTREPWNIPLRFYSTGRFQHAIYLGPLTDETDLKLVFDDGIAYIYEELATTVSVIDSVEKEKLVSLPNYLEWERKFIEKLKSPPFCFSSSSSSYSVADIKFIFKKTQATLFLSYSKQLKEFHERGNKPTEKFAAATVFEEIMAALFEWMDKIHPSVTKELQTKLENWKRI